MPERPSMGGEEFLKKKYDLHASEEVAEQARRTEKRTGEKVPQKPQDRIKNYLDRFEEILNRESEENLDADDHGTPSRERGIEALKLVLHRKFVTKPEDIPESYFELQKRIAREQGHGDVQITREMRDQLTEVLVADQEDSLDTWIDYLSSNDAPYPTWLKYWATRSILSMGEYDKEKHAFAKRTKGTVKPFPDLDREALAVVLDAIEKKVEKEGVTLPGLDEQGKAEFQKLLDTENFAKLYAFAIEKVTPESREGLENTKGKWMIYPKDSDHVPLVESLQGHGTGWCTAGESTAEIQLKGGDFHVYYSLDEDGQPTIPRAAIRMQGNSIAEVRGIAPNQNLDPFIGEVVQKKMHAFPDGKAYEKKAGDMQRLTTIEKKTHANQPLTKEDLIFLYELNGTIEGFGYKKDPRIKEIRSKRNPKEDAPTLFECEPRQIAWSPKEITPATKAYIGPLFPGVFALEHLEHVYTSFPEGRIERRSIEIGGKTAKEYEKELTKEGYRIDDYAKDILAKIKTSKERQEMDTVRLSVADLGFTRITRYDAICKRAKELGLELSPAEVGPALRLAMKDQPMGDWFRIDMEPLTDRHGRPELFDLGRNDDGSWLTTNYGNPEHEWYPEYSFVFSRRKP